MIAASRLAARTHRGSHIADRGSQVAARATRRIRVRIRYRSTEVPEILAGKTSRAAERQGLERLMRAARMLRPARSPSARAAVSAQPELEHEAARQSPLR